MNLWEVTIVLECETLEQAASLGEEAVEFLAASEPADWRCSVGSVHVHEEGE